MPRSVVHRDPPPSYDAINYQPNPIVWPQPLPITAPGVAANYNETTPLFNKPSSPTFRETIYTYRTHFLVFALILCLFKDQLLYAVLEQRTQIFWTNITASPVCSSIGTREYTGVSSYTPEGYYLDTSCQKRPVIIHGKTIPSPHSCQSVPILSSEPAVDKDGHTYMRNFTKTLTTAKWIVDFNESSCVPTWDEHSIPPIRDEQCHAYTTRRYTTFMSVSRVPPGLDPLSSCKNTPAIIDHQQVYPQIPCQLDRGIMRAEYFIKEPSCTPTWTEPVRYWQCEAYGLKKFWAVLEGMPSEFNIHEVCMQIPARFYAGPSNWVEKTPDSCEVEGLGRIVGHWSIDFNVPECHPVLSSTWEKGCWGSNNRRIEAEVKNIGQQEDWYRMCTTTPLRWGSEDYLPTQCEQRTASWFRKYLVAIYDIPDSSCF